MDTKKQVSSVPQIEETTEHENPVVVKVDSHDDEVNAALENYVPGSSLEKRLVRKVDLFVIPTLWLMCVLNFLDRTNMVDPLSLLCGF